ncbi:MAG: hypothetical protein HON53_07765 [Planctomycetaceae bacterium]|nr:hypothetical protein [Planctomycetaceae bacterium]MBT6158153.1 hypothetical protein [Planctomycetaceae bacterium]MBT6484443.1 hypothetical protein [Planctomycetaceae bacterium]MBT6494912.1 hypothetical protein [Planctomycetaceae bacterium]
MITIAVAICSLFAADTPTADVQLDRRHPSLKTGKEFRDELNKPLTATWQNVPARRVLGRMAESRKISILLDRRIDPTQPLAVDFGGQPLQSALESIAAKVDGQVSVLGNTVCIGPQESMAKLRTLTAVRFDELQQPTLRLSKGRLAELGERRTLHWNDLDRPSDLIQQIGKRYRLRIDGLEQIPHDLWASATLPSVNAVEALSIVLIQFDLTFRWNETANGLQIVSVPDKVSISRSYTPRGSSAAGTAKKWSANIDGLQTKVDGSRVTVTGTVEQHEAVAALLRPTRRRPTTRPVPGAVLPLEKRLYAKLKFERVPAVALIRRLEKTGIVFKYDEAKLKAAGIDINMPISMDLKNATADEVFAAFCKPLGLKYRTKGLTVTLSPK